MAKNGPIILIDDDRDDCELINEALKRMNISNKIVCLSNGKDALDYLKTTSEQPFIILSDVNMPRMNGIELRQHIEADEKLKKKSIPFIFISTTAGMHEINKAYELSVQGFFEKGNTVDELKDLLTEIYHYWQRCKHPNSR